MDRHSPQLDRFSRQGMRLAMLRVAGAVLRTRPLRSPRVIGAGRPRVVVLRPDHLGDVLLSRPALTWLREALPSGALSVAVGPWGAPSLQGLDVHTTIFRFP